MNNISKTYVQHMENENENENKDTIDKGVKNLILPFDTPEFIKTWSIWKEYKQQQFNFRYKGAYSEQGALTKLSKLTDNDQTAIAIIFQSIENGWKGFFKLKEDGKQRTEFNAQEFWADYCNTRGLV